MAKQFTPDEVVKVAKAVISECQNKGHKAGWVRFDMDRRIEKVRQQLFAYKNLADQIYYVANGEQTIDDLSYWLNESYNSYMEMEARYGG